MLSEMQKQIIKLKKQNGVCILAHSYQAHEIVEIADFTGDSYQLSVQATKTDAKTVLMCGVRFMAQTVKILSPDKKVLLSHPQAGCPMAQQMSAEYVSEQRARLGNCPVVCYINTTAELKTVCDVCVTSSCAAKVVAAMDADELLFVPDCNLGRFVAQTVPNKKIHLLQGGCPIHSAVTAQDVAQARALYPDALLLVHPECVSEVAALADYVGSTSGIMKFAQDSSAREFIIGTELSIAEHLQYACPDKRFYPLSKKLICPDMRLTTLPDVLNCLRGGGEEVTLDPRTIALARRCIDKMIELS